MAAVRDFDSTQLQADYDAILAQAGVTFTCQNTTVTGVWGSSSELLNPFEEQRRDEIRYTVFLTSSQLTTFPAIASTIVRNGVTFFINKIEYDAEGTGMNLDVIKSIK
jgi:hypothetical protein